jgi:hypothetical protein
VAGIVGFDRSAATIAALTVVGLAVFLTIRNEAFASPDLFFVVRVVLSFAVAVLGATIPGFLEIGWKGSGLAIRAGGAFALFVLTFVYTPASIQGRSDAERAMEAQQHAELLQGQGELLRGNQQILAVIAREKGCPARDAAGRAAPHGGGGCSGRGGRGAAAGQGRRVYRAACRVGTAAAVSKPNAAAARARAQALLDEGDFASARAVLAEGRADLRARREETAREEADLASEEARVARLSLRYRDAAALYAEGSGLGGVRPRGGLGPHDGRGGRAL